MGIKKKAYLSFDVGIVNLAYCLLDEEYNILLWNIVNINAPSYDKQCEKLIKELDNIEYDNLDDEYEIIVVIERQPCKNPKMRVISGQIQMYFALEKYSMKDIKISDRNTYISKIVYYSPKHKLRCYKRQEGDPPIVQKKLKSSYAIRKNLAIQHCSIMINRSGQKKEFIDLFNNNKKKADDLSDTYLQGVAYIMGL